ncbi:MAG: family peptidase [Petroclostridium sp.]|jgi:putative protease|uniref:peptidase U32 family protein n=1 Tax=Petroclostridium xylanilyticum TaxID=1792311 RepID=UPI000B9980CD|nr:U32 family peptidase [Petroclostridium xylanilyticum]MBZ4644862.1 peptidase [Clostridia bacterium]MDK2809557.1 family peptidase [Petroclostridium sp.]
MKKPELLAPAGNLEKLKMAVIYGADAVYLGGEEFGLRAAADNFNTEEMKEGVEFAHSRGKKVYVTANIIPHNEDLQGLPEYIREVSEIGVDALIVSDLGVFAIAKEVAPDLEIHISTQANNTNWKSAEFWHKLGAKRIILARELSLQEIKEIREKVPADVELECFVHGAMCISYSGRCLLSNYMANRDANRGACAHPCRWKYYLMEEKRPGEYMPVVENERGTFIYNSKDLCMIGHIPELLKSGISSLKIEGRVKSAYYVATVVKAYRQAIDAYMDNPGKYVFDPALLDELKKVSHREYTTGFYFGKPSGKEQIYHTSSYIREYDIVGLVKEYDPVTGIAIIEQKNRFFVGDEVEVVQPDKPFFFTQIIEEMRNEEGQAINVAPHPQMVLKIPMKVPVVPYSMLRKKGEEKDLSGR